MKRKVPKIQQVWKKFLNQVVKEYRKSYRLLSVRILERCLSKKFNLSPDYCKKVVEKWSKKENRNEIY